MNQGGLLAMDLCEHDLVNARKMSYRRLNKQSWDSIGVDDFNLLAKGKLSGLLELHSNQLHLASKLNERSDDDTFKAKSLGYEFGLLPLPSVVELTSVCGRLLARPLEAARR